MGPDGIENQIGSLIPINLSLVTYEDQIMSQKVVKYFTNKVGTNFFKGSSFPMMINCENQDVRFS
ncbi:MAG: hypothetical protein ACFFD7_10535 [Candidatus Thorarchaeota archaeon]